MKTQTKCTLSLSGLLIIEILPIPFTVLYCLYVVRQRPEWIFEMFDKLYSEKEELPTDTFSLNTHDPMITRRRCTISFSIMFLLDFLIPFTVISALFIVRKRPVWFKHVVERLYDDLFSTNTSIEDASGFIEHKYIELGKSNTAFALAIKSKSKH